MRRALYMLVGAVLFPVVIVVVCAVGFGVIGGVLALIHWALPAAVKVWANAWGPITMMVGLLALLLIAGAGAGNDFWRERQKRGRGQ